MTTSSHAVSRGIAFQRFPHWSNRGRRGRQIVVHPTSNRLRDHAQLSSNLGLTQSPFQHLHSLEASFLQGFKITRYSSRVSHIQLDAGYLRMVSYIMRDSISRSHLP